MADATLGYALLATLIVDTVVQCLFCVPSVARKTEKYFDISASVTFALCLLFSLLVQVYPTWALRHEFNFRQILATILGIVWTLRLGIFLLTRIRSVGEDKRFRDIKPNVLHFSAVWFLQIVWIFVTALPIYIANSVPAGAQPAFGTAADIVGILVWLAGFIFEVVADAQKAAFRKQRQEEPSTPHSAGFIRTGLWKWSRHPNYFGEITLWWGIFILCCSAITGAQWAVVISPIFVACLLCFVSGIPMLEASADERFGQHPEYRRYKASTSILIPWPPKRGAGEEWQ